MLKHACILRPLHLLRLAFSAAGGARLRSPLQGSLSSGSAPQSPPLQGEVPPQAAEGCGAWPCHYPFGPPQPLRRGRCFASARKFAPSQGPRDDASIVPYEAQGRVLPGFAGYLPPQGGNAPLSLRLAAHPAPLTGEPFQAAAPRKASPARGGAAAGGGGVRRLALPLPFRTAAACVGADALHRPASLRHRKAPRDDASIVPYEAQGRVLPGFAGYLPPQGGNAPLSLRLAAHPAPLTGEPFKRQRPAKPPLQGKVPPQRKNSPAPGLWVRGLFCRDAGGPFGGQRPADSGVSVSETAASGVAGGASASSPRRHSRCSSSGICSAAQVPSSCCVISSSISS